MKNKYILILSSIALAAIYLPLIFAGPRAASDFPLASNVSVQEGFSFPQTWSARGGNGLGENVIFTLWSWPADFLFGLGANLGLSFSLLTRILLLIPIFFIGIYSSHKFLSTYKVPSPYRFVGVLFFLLNSYILLLIDGGQLSLALAYVMFPLMLIQTQISASGNWRDKVNAGILFVLLTIFDIRFAYMFGILIILRIVHELIFSESKDRFTVLRGWLMAGLFIGVVWFIANLYWIIPFILFRSSSIPVYLTSSSQLSFLNFTQLFNAFSVQQPNWPLNSFGQIAHPDWRFLIFIVLPVIVMFKRRISKDVLFTLAIFLVGVFLTKGNNPPIEGAYEFLFTKFPGFFMFRDSTKFFVFIALALSALIPIGLQVIESRIPRLKNYMSLLFIVFLFAVVSPVWQGKMTGLFSPPQFEDSYRAFSETINRDTRFGRVLWLPSRPPLGYSDPKHPTMEGLTLAGKRPFSTANVGVYERFNFLREAPFAKELLEIAGISYVAYPYYDERKRTVSPDEAAYYQTFTQQMSQTLWVDRQISEYPIVAFKAKTNPSLFSVSSNLWWVLGSDSFYQEVAQLQNFKIKNNPLIYVEGAKDVFNRFKETDFGTIILYERDENDLLGQILQSDIQAEKPAFTRDTNMWEVDINDISKWREFLQEKYSLDNTDFGGDATLVAEEKGSLTIDAVPSDANYLFIRVLKSPAGGAVNVVQNDNLVGRSTVDNSLGEKLWGISVGNPNTQKLYMNAQFHWIVFPITGTTKTSITFTGPVNAMSDMFFVSEETYKNAKEYASEIVASKKVIAWKDLSSLERQQLFVSNDENAVDHTKISQTKYEVRMGDTPQQKRMVLFSQSYDPKWEANGIAALPVYSLINGFVVNESSFSVVYTPQSYVFPQIVILSISLTAFLTVVVIYKKRK